MMITQEFNIEFEMRTGMNELDHRILLLLKQHRGVPKEFRPEQGFEPRDSGDADAVLNQLGYQPNWKHFEYVRPQTT